MVKTSFSVEVGLTDVKEVKLLENIYERKSSLTGKSDISDMCGRADIYIYILMQ